MSKGVNDLTAERIAKFLARAGIASRREAERFIEAGRVTVNGKKLTTPAFKVCDNDIVTFDGEVVGSKPSARLWRYHKPSGLVTSHRDEKGRETVFEKLPKELGRVISVGRLDLTSEGLLLLTNDGALARSLELPSTGWARRYRARAYGNVTQEALDTLQKGITIDGVKTGPIEAVLDKQQRGNVWISVTIREGKNREVRRALNELGLEVNRLIRTSYGPFQLGQLSRGETAEVRNKTLRDQVGHLVHIPKIDAAQRRAIDKAASKAKKPARATGKKTNFRNSKQANKDDTFEGKAGSRRGSKALNRKTRNEKYKSPNSQNKMPKGRGKFAKR